MKTFTFNVDKKVIAIERNRFKIKAKTKEEAQELLNIILTRPYNQFIDSDYFDSVELLTNTIEEFDMFNRSPEIVITQN